LQRQAEFLSYVSNSVDIESQFIKVSFCKNLTAKLFKKVNITVIYDFETCGFKTEETDDFSGGSNNLEREFHSALF